MIHVFPYVIHVFPYVIHVFPYVVIHVFPLYVVHVFPCMNYIPLFLLTYHGASKWNLNPNAESEAMDGERICYCQINRQATAFQCFIPLPSCFCLRNEATEEQMSDMSKLVVRHTAPCIRHWLVLCWFCAVGWPTSTSFYVQKRKKLLGRVVVLKNVHRGVLLFRNEDNSDVCRFVLLFPHPSF